MDLRKQHGIDDAQEQDQSKLIRDIRTPLQQIWDAIMTREGFVFFTGALLLVMLFLGAAFWELVVIFWMIIHMCFNSKQKFARLPMRVPNVYPGKDFGDISPAGGYNKAGGMFYIGNDRKSHEELWIGKGDILTHFLILGTTGAGKTETLVSLSFNYLAVGSGFIYVDPKAAPKLGAQIYTMCRIMGRDDDFLVINYMADIVGQQTLQSKGHGRAPLRQSNTQNPFAFGTANQLTQLLFALMPGDDGGANGIFASNAQTLISGLMAALVELRDKGEIVLSILIIKYYLLDVKNIDALARDSRLSKESLASLHGALNNVGWSIDKPIDKQIRSFEEQYGYAKSYFGRALSLLVDNYSRIFKVSHGEVDNIDIITSRRICVTLIPSMDKDPKELKSLGQLCLSGVRNACAVGLGDKLQGSLDDVLGALPTDARTPFGVEVDEYAAIETPGFEILLTQGRGLGIAVIVASQDFAGIKRASEAAAEQIISNCKVKMFMTSEDPNQTYNLIKSLAGEVTVLRTTGYAAMQRNDSADYLDKMDASATNVSRVDFRDLQQQVEGEAHIFFKGKMIRGRTFYAAPPLKDYQVIKVNTFLKLQPPDNGEEKMRRGAGKDLYDALCEALSSDQEISVSLPEYQVFDRMEAIFEQFKEDKSIPRPELAIKALMSAMNVVYMYSADGGIPDPYDGLNSEALTKYIIPHEVFEDLVSIEQKISGKSETEVREKMEKTCNNMTKTVEECYKEPYPQDRPENAKFAMNCVQNLLKSNIWKT